MAAVLSDVLQEKHMTLDLRAETRDEALREIVATMRGATQVAEPEKFLGEVFAREEVHSTYMGNGVAFPHADGPGEADHSGNRPQLRGRGLRSRR